MYRYVAPVPRVLITGFIILTLAAVAACVDAPQTGPAAGSTVLAGEAATPAPASTTIPTPLPVVTVADPVPLATLPADLATPLAVETPGIFATFDLSNFTAHPGELLSLHAQGFAPGETVALRFAGNPDIPAGEFLVGPVGDLVGATLRVPGLPEGQHTLVATGASSGREVSRVISVIAFHPYVTLTSYAIHVGEAFGFNGASFVPGEQVQVFLDGAETALATVTADDRGNILQEMLVRATPQHVGKHDLEFVSSRTGARLPVAFEVLAFVPLMELTTYAGPPGSVVSFTGHGFASSETVHAYIQLESGRQEVSSFVADIDGAFRDAGQFTVPANTDRNLTVVLEGEQSRVPVSQRFGLLPLAPWAGLSSYSGPPGTQIDLYGKGFASGEPVEISLGSGQSAIAVLTAIGDSRGEFQVGPFAIPAEAQGTITFGYKGQNSGGAASTDFTVTSAQ